jgi:ABC-type polysaccharide/polyol phosphate export permease
MTPDLVSAAKAFRLAATLAVIDTRLRYRRTTLGPFWTTLSTAAMVLAVGLVYGHIFGSDGKPNVADYMPFLGIGFVLWTFISTSLAEACRVISASGELIRSLELPLSLHVFRMFARNVVFLAHNAIVILVLWLFFQWPIDGSILLSLFGLLLLAISVLGLASALAVLCTRFRDAAEFVQASLQLLFLATPIIWPPAVLRETRIPWLLDANPVFYLIEAVRAPLLGQPLTPTLYLGAFVVAVTSAGLGYWALRTYRDRVAYWL